MVEAKCKKCKWLDVFEEFCLLGRDAKKCISFKARRGDDSLAKRLIDAHGNGVIDEDKIRGTKKQTKKKS